MTYASFWVRKEILAAVVDQPHTVHLPQYARRHGHAALRVLRLDGPKNGDTDLSLGDRLRHPDPLPAETIIDREQEFQVRRHVLRLPLRHRAVIVWRYGLGGQPQRTLGDIGRCLGLSKERVRQIEVAALARLRDTIVDRPRLRGRRIEAESTR
jgi:DNA-directed RNA polymerase sigma subunit (sigma70/sigma32)